MFYIPKTTCSKITLDSSIILDYPFSFATTGIVQTSDIMEVTNTSVDNTITLPDSTNTTNGFSIYFNNIGLVAFSILLNSTGTLLTTVPAGQAVNIYLSDNTTQDGSWRIVPLGNNFGVVSNIIVQNLNDTLTVTDGNITNPGGTVTITPVDVISNLTNLTTSVSGFVTYDADLIAYKTAGLNAGSNVNIQSPYGNEGDTVIAVNDSLVLNNIEFGSTTINESGIQSLSKDDYSIDTMANLVINSTVISPDGVITANLIKATTLDSAAASRAWGRFTDTSGVLTTASSYNIASIELTNNQYKITFTTPLENNDYVVQINFSNVNSTFPLVTRIGYDVIRDPDFVNIVLCDASGEKLQDVPEGFSINIFAN